MPPPHFFTGPEFILESLYSLIVIISCLIIYFKTKEIYKLSSHKGIGIFRNAFLFFGIAFFSRYFLRFITLISDYQIDRIIFGLGFFFFVYFGTMAALLLIYSVLWKRFKELKKQTKTYRIT